MRVATWLLVKTKEQNKEFLALLTPKRGGVVVSEHNVTFKGT